jgi:hypothetical protein
LRVAVFREELGLAGGSVAAWSMWFERRVVNCEARVLRSYVEAVNEGVLTVEYGNVKGGGLIDGVGCVGSVFVYVLLCEGGLKVVFVGGVWYVWQLRLLNSFNITCLSYNLLFCDCASITRRQ